MVTDAEVGQQLERMANAFGMPYGVKVRGMVAEYARALRGDGVRPDELAAAVDEVNASSPRFPKIRELRDVITRRRAARHQVGFSPAAPGPTICPRCQREPFEAGFEMADGRVIGRTRCGCPASSPGWHTERAQAWNQERGAA